MDVLLEELGSVLEISVVISVGTLERTPIFSVAELFCWTVLVFLSSGVREDMESSSNTVVSKELGTDVLTRVSLELEGISIGNVTLDGSESAEADECVSCPELSLAPLIPAVFLEG